MNGPEHYAEAQRLAGIATELHTETMRDWSSRSQLDSDTAVVAAMASLAQVHATLALAAATVQDARFCNVQAWLEVAS